MDTAQAQILGALDELEHLDPEGPHPRVVRVTFRAYQAAVEDELREIAAGITCESRAVEMGRTADAGSLAVIAATTAVIGLLLWRFHRVRKDLSAAAIEQEALRRSEERFRSLLLYASDVVVVLTTEGSVRWVSASAQRILGHRDDALTGSSLLPLVQPEDAASVREFLARCAGEPAAIHSVELRFLRGDGGWAVLEARGSSQLDNPGVGGIVVNCRDVSERRAIERQLIHSQKMEAVGRLAGGVAHDFNNLLQALLAAVQVLRARRDDPEGLAATVADIERDVRRGAALTRQLLLFSRREVVKPERLDLSQVVRGEGELLLRLVREDIRLGFDLTPEVLAVEGDRWPELKVIAMSGYTEDEAVRRGVSEGKVRFLQKPFDMDTLAREVRAALLE